MRRFGILLVCMTVSGVVSAAGVLVSAAGPGASVDDYPQANGRILFTRCSEAKGCQIYTANPDGSSRRRVTTEGDNFQGDWSPDGTRIAYVGTASGDVAIWIADADGSHARQLTPNDPESDNFDPRFVPNGRRILFTNCLGDDCDGGIGSVRPDGTHLHLVTPNSGDSYNIADLAPGGQRMAYMRWHVDGVKMAIYVSGADGANERRITPPRLQGWGPDWSPTGGPILFSSQIFRDRPTPALYSVWPDGSRLQALTTPPYPHADWAGAYSPDGARIIFNSDRRYADFCCGDLFTMDADGQNLHRIRLPFDAYEPRWGTAPLLPSRGRVVTPVPRTPGGAPCNYVTALRPTPVCP